MATNFYWRRSGATNSYELSTNKYRTPSLCIRDGSITKYVPLTSTSANMLSFKTQYSGTTYGIMSPGAEWTQETMPVGAYWYSVAYGNGTFVAVAGNASNIAATSPDGITWTQRTLPASANWYSVAYGNGAFVAISGNGSTISATSP